MTTSGQICEMSYTVYCNTYCNMGQPYCNILQYAFCHIVSTLFPKFYQYQMTNPRLFQLENICRQNSFERNINSLTTLTGKKTQWEKQHLLLFSVYFQKILSFNVFKFEIEKERVNQSPFFVFIYA